MSSKIKTAFMPQLAISSGITNVEFYKKAFNANEYLRINNDDGSIHVIILMIDEAMFMLYEVTQWSGTRVPDNGSGGTVTIGLFVEDVQQVVDDAVAAGAQLVSPVTEEEYGWKMGSIIDPFGHRWEILRRM